MDITIGLGLGAVGLALGTAIGCTGIGGILLVPVLTYVIGLDIQQSIAAALVSYLPSGVLVVVLYARRGSIQWDAAWPLCLAALPAAFVGARLTSYTPASALETLIAALMLGGGIYTLLPRGGAPATCRTIGVLHLAGLGAVTGLLSALTGAGGAFVLVPLLIVLGQPALFAIGLGQVVQLPIAAVASAANLAGGQIDLELGLVLAAGLAAGVALGTPLAHALPQAALRRLLGVTVVLAGTGMLVRVLWRVLAAL